MKTIQSLLSIIALLAMAQPASAAVPTTINYQGRLTDGQGVIQSGTKAMALRIYNAATGGTQLYAETIGNVHLDANGIYSFQFGAAGISDTLVTETLATTDGTTLSYQKTLSNTPVLPGTASITDGTYNWNEIEGNPGAPAAATATVVSGFVVGATVTNGGSGYTDPPTVTISGNGTGAAATAIVAGGSVTEINITNAGSGYTTGATITIAPPPSPFVVNYSGGTITATYASAPAAGQTITATYRYSATGISGALASGPDQWLELTIDGTVQTPRQKVLAVPFAMMAQMAENSSGLLAKQISDLSIDLARLAGGIPSDSTFGQTFSTSKSSVVVGETTLMDKGTHYAPIHEQSSSVSYTGGSTNLSQDVADLPVRGIFYRRGSQGGGSGPGTVTFAYTDNTSSVINLTITPGDQYQANPNPQKTVKRIDLFYQDTYSYGLWMTTRINKSGAIYLTIPSSLLPRSKIGFFLNKSLASQADQLSAQLVGTLGSQSIDIESYTPITSSIGTPQKVVVSFNAANSNLENYSSINGFLVRFSE
jgi:hypothetical protein